jgi:AmmeMemoRadiSam system protein B
MIASKTNPKLRKIGAHPVTHNGQRGYVLRDPLQLSDQSVFVPQELAVALALMDGTNDIPMLKLKLAAQTGMRVPDGLLEHFIDYLDNAYLLDNERAADALRQAVDTFRCAGSRPPASAGLSYPAEPDDLRALLDGYVAALDEPPADMPGARGVLSPHIDYQRGGLTYAATWTAAATAAREAELVVIFGTDHAGGELLTLTRQSYATPYGLMPTDQEAVDRLAAAVGGGEAFASELHHRAEHSVELSLTWVHHMRNGDPVPTVPVLCGSFHGFITDDRAPMDDPAVTAVVEALQAIAAGRRTLFVASGDLAHMGPAFGTPPLGWADRAKLYVDDRKLIDAICAGDAVGFFEMLKAEGDRRNVCGLAPIYLMLRALGESVGTRVAYDRCPADEDFTSVVSVGGVVLE